MADLKRRLPANVPGDFYVDATCIDCDACRWIAPATFDEANDQSRVHRQPATPDEERLAEQALLSCPTGSIGTVRRRNLAASIAALPRPIDAGVYHCGFHDEQSFGAASWLIVRPQGNVLVDVPRFAAPLVQRLEELGGVSLLFLTHRDDVGDHAKFAAHFRCERVLHRADLDAGTRGVERLLDGLEPTALAHDLLAIPTPGHTAGSACLLHAPRGLDDESGRHLFSGDHLAWSRELGHPYAFKNACWFDWSVLRSSMQRLAPIPFDWILPGHGTPGHLPAAQMKTAMARCLAWMERA